ncbi:DinB family protein [uncultured Cellulomonas sp.]|uniref:DinB family protein n=1 Tax=uncultured Cellulomonas sp. TaxID=189682 RepID=UPI00262E82CB|nr:DinB family protein [uncultured Cellulomonas sp.]
MTDDARPAAARPDVEPDTKDWTWVLERACPECGFVAADVAPADVPARVRELTPRWRAALARPDARTRPAPGVWSALEYAAHVRDVHRLFADRLRLVLEHDDPVFANWDQDATAVQDRYAEQHPAVVADELATAAAAFADQVEAVPDDALDRPARRSNGSRFTVRTLVQYYLHDVVHHTHDVGA